MSTGGDLPRIEPGRTGAVLHVRVVPRARRAGPAGLHGDALKIAVTAPPVDGAANAAVLKLLAEALDVPRSSLRIVRGETGRDKVVEVTSLDAPTLRARVRPLVEPS